MVDKFSIVNCTEKINKFIIEARLQVVMKMFHSTSGYKNAN